VTAISANSNNGYEICCKHQFLHSKAYDVIANPQGARAFIIFFFLKFSRAYLPFDVIILYTGAMLCCGKFSAAAPKTMDAKRKA
jgi:hypothetical protein